MSILNDLVLVLSAIGTISLFIEPCSSYYRSSYGMTCSRTQRCDSQQQLSCQEGFCNCMKADEMLYDNETRQCVSKAGERCKYSLDESFVNSPRYEIIPCVGNATCNSNGVCVCSSKHYEDTTGICVEKKTRMEVCSSNDECQSPPAFNVHLSCVNQVCECDPRVSHFELFSVKLLKMTDYNRYYDYPLDYVFQECMGLVGHSCTRTLQTLPYNNDPLPFCTNNAECSSNNICTCDDPNFFTHPNGSCLPRQHHGGNCSSDSECVSKLHVKFYCIDGLCSCNPSTSVYSNYKSYCVGLVGSACINHQCTTGASCYHNDYETKTCSCQEGTYEYDSLCHKKKLRLENCSSGNHCDTKTNKFLSCINGICDCNPEYSRHDKTLSTVNFQCVALVGEQCGADIKCTSNAVCSSLINGSYCECKPGSDIKTIDRTCTVDYGSQCDENEVCSQGLSCTENKCYCEYPKDQIFYPDIHRCRSIVWAPCTKNNECVDNAICVLFPNSITGYCQCGENYVESINGECDLKFGQHCGLNLKAGDKCDRFASLKCIDSACSCYNGEFAEYNSDFRKCVALVGGKCDFEKENECTENAECGKRVPDLPSRCTCKLNFVPTENYTCSSV